MNKLLKSILGLKTQTINPQTTLSALLLCLAITAGASPASAGGRPESDFKDWFGHIGAGWAFPEGSTFKDDFTINGGVMYWPSKWPVGIELDLAYTDLSMSRSTIDRINHMIDQAPDNEGEISSGSINNWQISLNLIWGPGENSRGVYFIAGASVNFLEARLNQTGLVYYPPICDPWYWWICYPGGWAPGNITVAKQSATQYGYNLGIGYNFDELGRYYIDFKYQSINTSAGSMEYMPVTIGMRW